MEVRYGDYYYNDDPNWKSIPYYPEQETPYYGPEEEQYQFPMQNEYYIVGSKTKRKPKPKPKPTITDTSDVKQETKSNEKLYIGLLMGSTALFLVTLFYFLFVQKKK